MNTDLSRAKSILLSTGCTCILCKGETVYESRLRGVKPLLDFLDSGTELTGFSAADKVVGRATAFLYCLLGVKAVYAPVISRAALQVLEEQGIETVYDTCVEAIFNHRRDGFCPMETATKAICDPHTALTAIRQTLQKLQSH